MRFWQDLGQLLKILAVLIVLSMGLYQYSHAQLAPLEFTEEDGSPSTTPHQVKLSNGSLTNNGNGTISINTGGGSGDSVTVNSTAVDTTANLLDNTDITWTLTDGGAGGPDDVTGTVVDDSHNHVITNIDSFTKANLETQTSDVSDYAEADGDTFTGEHNFGGATSIEVPNGTGPTVDAAGEVAVDTDGDGSNVTTGVQEYFSGSDTFFLFGVREYPLVSGAVLKFNNLNNDIEWGSDNSGGGGGGSGDITSVGDVASGAAFDGTQGTTLTFNNAGGDATLDYDGTDLESSHPLLANGLFITTVGLDGEGAVDIDYGSADITDHTFISDNGTNVVLDGTASTIGTSAIIHNDAMDASSELAAIMDDETGTGVLVFGTAPTFTTSITSTLVITDLVDASGAVDLDFGSGDVTDMSFETDGGTVTMDGSITSSSGGLTLDNGVIFIKEQAEANSTKAAYGQIWVNTATPNELWFTDDADNDIQLGTPGSTAYDDIGDPDAASTIVFADTETVTWQSASDGEDFFTIDLTDSTLTGATGGLVIQTADNDDANFDPFKIIDDSGGTPDTLLFIDHTGTITTGIWNAGAVTSSGTVEGATITEGGVAVYNDDEIDTYSEINTIVTDVTLTHNGLIDTAAELDAIVSDENILVETEIDASSELLAIMDDETGTGALVFGTSPTFTTGITVPDGSISPAEVDTDLRQTSFGITIDGGGSAITTGVKGYIEIPFDCTITQATVLLDQSGSIVIDVWKDTYANYPPTDADSITASAPPTVSTATKSQDGTLTGWTTSVTEGDVVGFNVDSATTTERAHLIIKVDKT